VLGFQIEYENTNTKGFNGQLAKDVSGVSVGPYFSWRASETWVLTGVATYGRFSTDVSVLQLDGSFDRSRWRANLEAIGQYQAGAFVLRPSIAFDYYDYGAAEFELSGTLAGNPTNIMSEVGGARYGALTPELEISRPFVTSRSIMSPYVSVSASYWIDRVNYGFGTAGTEADDLTWATRLGVRAQASDAVFLEASVGYLSLFEADLDSTEASIYLSVNF